MTTLPATSPPASLMLATDLSPRCDRALDRAAGLAQAWKAELIVAHVLDPAAHPDQALAWAALPIPAVTAMPCISPANRSIVTWPDSPYVPRCGS
ncbi:universal stress protein [Cupriavidus metallidurans]|uniref:universal stress protein n=1 Tax=Cupriavidus metallidurans TaxID=119219 RepID=UPI000A885B62|nr:universal stress protein [Cupriavidus metallidurans]